MPVNYEQRLMDGDSYIWTGRFQNLNNISHWHMEHEIVACQTGSANIMLGEQLFRIHAGMAVFCPSGQVHYIQSEKDSILVVAIFDHTLTASITNRVMLKTPVFHDHYQTCKQLLDIHRELQEKNRFYTERSNAMLIQLVADIFRNEALTANIAGPDTLMRYKHLLNTIDETYEFLTFQEAAALMKMSSAYFSRYFKRISGIHFSTYLNLVKIDHAVSMLKESPDITTAVLMQRCGFNTLRTFNRVFKAVTGHSPRQLPKDYVFSLRSMPKEHIAFDPTLDSSILLPE